MASRTMPAIPTDNVDVSGFLKRFSRFGEFPSVQRYVDLFEPTGTVQHPGMPRPLSGEKIREFISGALGLMPDFRLKPVAWCSHGAFVFVEARTSGSVRGTQATWLAIYCVRLSGDRVATGRSYYDRAEIFAQLGGDRTGRVEGLEPSANFGTLGSADATRMARIDDEFIRPYVEAWLAPNGRQILEFYSLPGSAVIPGCGRVPREDVLRTRVGIADAGTLRQHCEAYAACPHDVFFHWRMTGSLEGRPFEVGAAERVSLDGFRIAESAIYFDTVSIEAVRDPSLASLTIFDAAK